MLWEHRLVTPGDDFALASSLVADKWTYPNSVRDIVAEDRLTVEQCADCRNQDTEEEKSRRTQPGPMCLSAC